MRILLLCSVLVCLLLGANSLSAPYKAIYIDWHLNWNAPEQSVLQASNAGYNVIILAFYLTGGAADMALAWQGLPAATKQATMATVHANGGVVIVSFGGATDSPYGNNARNLGITVAQWVQTHYLDGVDFDLENLGTGFTAGSMTAAQTVQWISDITSGSHSILGDAGVITHAPQGPYFGPIGSTVTWAGTTGGYTGVNANVGNLIDFYLIQFYNQGVNCYVDYNGLFVTSGTSCPVFPLTSVNEIATAGIPLSKIVVGKPVTSADASNGYVTPANLRTFFQTAAQQYGWNAGLMGWLWNDPATTTSWVQTVYPPGASTAAAATTTTAKAATTTTTAKATTAAASTSTTAKASTATTATTAAASISSASTTSATTCAGRAAGIYCVDDTRFIWCPDNIIQSCAPGTRCYQSGTSIVCNF